MRVRLLLSVIPVLLWATIGLADVYVSQSSSGIPGFAEHEDASFTAFISEDRLKLVDDESGRYLIVRLDLGVVWEVNPETLEYAETPISRWADKGAEKRATDQRIIRDLQEGESPLSDEEQEALLRDKGLRRDGRVLVTTEETGETVQMFGLVAKQVLIRRNGLAIFELWVAEAIPCPAGLKRLYRSLGLWYPEVLAALDAVAGFPLRTEVLFDLGEGSTRLASAVNRRPVEMPRLPSGAFELPGGYTRISAEALRETGLLDCARRTCANQRPADECVWELIPPFGEHPFCSMDCVEALVIEMDLEDPRTWPRGVSRSR